MTADNKKPDGSPRPVLLECKGNGSLCYTFGSSLETQNLLYTCTVISSRS